MWIKPAPQTNSTSELFASDSEAASSHCPPAYPSCDPSIGPGPALNLDQPSAPVPAPVFTNASGADAAAPSTTVTPGPTATLLPKPQSALAANIQHFGNRNFVGLLILGILVFIGVVLWLTFGVWPRRTMRRLRARRSKAEGEGMGGIERALGGGRGAQSRDLGRQRGSVPEAAPVRITPSPIESEEEKARSEEGSDVPNTSQESDELEVDALEKVSAGAQRRSPPRVHFA